MTYTIRDAIIEDVAHTLETMGKIAAIKYLRNRMAQMLLMPLRDCKNIVDQLDSGIRPEYYQGRKRYRIFRDI